MLNGLVYPRDAVARCFRGWTIFGVAWLFFMRSRHIGVSGWFQSWGGYLALWGLCVVDSVQQRSLHTLSGWLFLQATLLAAFAGWYALLALCGLSSQFGKTRVRSLPASPLVTAVDADQPGECARCLPSRCMSQPPAQVEAASPVDRVVVRVDSANELDHVPMRIDSFGECDPARLLALCEVITLSLVITPEQDRVRASAAWSRMSTDSKRGIAVSSFLLLDHDVFE